MRGISAPGGGLPAYGTEQSTCCQAQAGAQPQGWLALSAWGDQLQPPGTGVHFHQHLLTKAFFFFFLGESHF